MNEGRPTEPENYSADSYDDEIELIDLLRVIWRWKVFIVIMAIFCSLAVAGYAIVKYPPKFLTECTVELNFYGIDKKQNPDGSRFEKEQILAPHILEKVMDVTQTDEKKGDLGNLRELIAVTSIVPNSFLEDRKQDGSEGDLFVPNQFRLSFLTQTKDFLSPQKKGDILLKIVDAYRNDFNRRFGEQPLTAVDFPAEFLAKYDYMEIVDIFRLRLNDLVALLDDKIKTAGAFKSKKTGLTFSDIRFDVTIRDIELAWPQAVVKSKQLTRYPGRLADKYTHRLKKIELAKNKKDLEASVAVKLLQEVRRRPVDVGEVDKKKGEAGFLLDSSFVEKLKQDDYLSMLLKTALSAGIESAKLEAEKLDLEQEIAFLQKSAAKEDRDRRTEETQRLFGEVERLFAELRDKITSLSQQANDLNREHLLYIVDNAVAVVEGPKSHVIRSKNPLMMTALSAIIALFLAVFMAFFFDYLRVRRQNPTGRFKEPI